MSELYKSIEAACIAHGETVSSMCIAIGKSKSLMSDLKAGRKKSLSSEVLREIADYLHEPMDVIVGRSLPSEYSDSESTMDVRRIFRDRPEMKMLFDAGMKATPQTVRQTAAFLEGLAGGEEDSD